MAGNIPLIDLSRCGLLVGDERNIDTEALAGIGKQLYHALSTSGFAYLSNHGIPKKEIEDVNNVGDKFFALPDEEKRELYTHNFQFAYDPVHSTKADTKNTDYNEGLRITGQSFQNDDLPWPNIPELRENCLKLAENCKLLLWRLLKALGVAMKLKDPDYFYKVHSLVNRKGNTSMFKLLQYPPVESDEVMSENHARIGEHADWVTLIFLFQDNVGGLQVMNDNGEFVDVTPIPDTIVVDVGDTLQKWSAGRLKSTVHRVVAPKDPEKRKIIRKSIVYFGQANEDVLIEPLQFADGKDDKIDPNEKPITAFLCTDFVRTHFHIWCGRGFISLHS